MNGGIVVGLSPPVRNPQHTLIKMLDSVKRAPEPETLPFPYNKAAFCKYEPIEKKIAAAKVLIVNDLLRYESDLSELAFRDWQDQVKSKLDFERKVSSLA